MRERFLKDLESKKIQAITNYFSDRKPIALTTYPDQHPAHPAPEGGEELGNSHPQLAGTCFGSNKTKDEGTSFGSMFFLCFFSPRIPAQWIFLLFSWHLCRLKFLSFFLFMFFQFAFFVLSFSLAFFLLSLRFFFSFVFRVFSFSSSRLYLFPSLFFYLSLFLSFSFSLSLFLSFSFSLFRSFSLSLFLSSSLPLFLSSSLPLFLSSSFSFSFCLKTWHYVQHPLVLVLAVAAALRDCFSQVWMWSCGISRLEFPTAKKRNSGLCGREQCLR